MVCEREVRKGVGMGGNNGGIRELSPLKVVPVR